MIAGRGGDTDVLSAVPESTPTLGPAMGGLAIASPAREGPFVVEGKHAVVFGAQRGRIDAVTIDGAVVLTDLDARLGSAANIVLHPGMARREFAGRDGTCVESVIVAATLPLVVIQWGREGERLPKTVRFDLHCDGVDHDIAKGRNGISLMARGGALIAIGVSPPAEDISISEEGGGRYRVVLHPSDVRPLSLTVASGAPASVRTALAAAGHLPAHARRAASSPLQDGLVLATGVAEIDDGVAWARARLRGYLDRAAWPNQPGPGLPGLGVNPTAELVAGLAAIGSGDIEAAHPTITGPAGPNNPTGAMLAARLGSVLGDASQALRHARAWLNSDLPATTSHPPEGGLRSLVLGALADSLRHGAPEPVISELRRLASRSGSGADGRHASLDNTPVGRSLPVVGARPKTPSWSGWLGALLAGEPAMKIPPGATSEIDAVRRAASLFRTDPDSAWVTWRGALSVGLVRGPEGPGSWDAINPLAREKDGSLVGELVLTLLHGLLGLNPDAPSGRLRLAPNLPSHVTEFSVLGITLGNAAISMRYQRTGRSHLFTIEPDFAAVPPVVVFEPAVPGQVREIRVDGEVADLQIRPIGSSTVVAIQIPIDGPRSIEVTTS